MMSLTAVFWLLVIIMGVVGGFRGWAKEILVVFSMIVGLAINWAMLTYIGGAADALQSMNPTLRFGLRATMFLVLAYFGYRTPGLSAVASGKLAREKLQDWMLGLVLGLINGYFLVGTLWYFLHEAGYPFPYVMPPTDPGVLRYLDYMPPNLLSGTPLIFILIASFVFVIVVFI